MSRKYHQISALQAIRQRTIQQFGHIDRPVVQDTLERMAAAIGVTEALSGITRKPTETTDLFRKRVATNTNKVSARIEHFVEGTRTTLGDRRAQLIEEADKAAGLVAGGPFDTEIRLSFQAKDGSDQIKYLGLLKEKGDGAQLAAILDAPVILTGLDEKFRDDFRTGYVAEKAPELTAEIETLDDLLNASETVARTAQSFSDELAQTSQREAESPEEQARQAQQAADARAAVEAQAALDAAMGAV